MPVIRTDVIRRLILRGPGRKPTLPAMKARNTAVLFLTGGVIGPVLFVVLFLIMGWTRPGYDPMRMYLSYLSRGVGGWVAIVTTVVSGLLTAAGAVGLQWALRTGPRPRWAPILIGIAAVGLALMGMLLVEPARGYPPGTPLGPPKHPSFVGALHDWAAGVAFLSLPAAMIVMARRFAKEGDGGRWAAYSSLSAVATVSFLVGSFYPTVVLGLLERVALLVAAGWVALVMWRFRREATRRPIGA
jgi:hypothetical membrane protein